MRHMKHSLLTRISVCLLAGFLGVFLLQPLGALARVDVSLGGGLGGEGDPLDSNDYTNGGGGGDTDVHEDSSAPVEDIFLGIIRTIFVDESGAVLLPFFQGGSPVIQFILIPAIDSAAVTHAN